MLETRRNPILNPARTVDPDRAKPMITELAKPHDPAAQVYAWIVAGCAEDDITEAVEELFPESKPRKLMQAAMKRIAAAADVNRECVIGWCIEATRTVYQRALESNNLPAALQAIRQLHELTTAQTSET